jgi:hypothetical protein
VKELGEISVTTAFADHKIKVLYHNPQKLDFGRYAIQEIKLNGHPLEFKPLERSSALVTRAAFLAAAGNELNLIEVILAPANS